MNPIKLRVEAKDAAALSDDLTTWTSNSGIDPCLEVFIESGKTTNSDSPIRYLAYVDESFFEQFPVWRQCIEQ